MKRPTVKGRRKRLGFVPLRAFPPSAPMDYPQPAQHTVGFIRSQARVHPQSGCDSLSALGFPPNYATYRRVHLQSASFRARAGIALGLPNCQRTAKAKASNIQYRCPGRPRPGIRSVESRKIESCDLIGYLGESKGEFRVTLPRTRRFRASRLSAAPPCPADPAPIYHGLGHDGSRAALVGV